MPREYMDALAAWLTFKAGMLSHFLIGAVAAAVPVVMRQGLSKRQAAVMVVAGALGASVFARPFALWLDPYVVGSYDDIVQACAFTIGLFSMRIAEELIRYLERRSQRLLDRKIG